MFMFGAFITSLEVGWYLMMMAFIDDIKNDFTSINETPETKKNQSALHDSIQFHSRVKQLRP